MDLANKQVARPFTEPLGHACLNICIALLDHRLSGHVHESVIVGFLAVLEMDEANRAFFEALIFTPKLFAFVKIATFLVLRKAVLPAEVGFAEDHRNVRALYEPQSRYRIHLGHIFAVLRQANQGQHHFDGLHAMVRRRKTVFCHAINISISGFRDFVCDRVKKARDQCCRLASAHPMSCLLMPTSA